MSEKKNDIYIFTYYRKQIILKIKQNHYILTQIPTKSKKKTNKIKYNNIIIIENPKLKERRKKNLKKKKKNKREKKL